MSKLARRVWFEESESRLLNLGVGVGKLGLGFYVGALAFARHMPGAVVGGCALAAVLDILPTLMQGQEVGKSWSYRIKTASLVRGFQLSLLVHCLARALDHSDELFRRLDGRIPLLPQLSVEQIRSRMWSYGYGAGAICTILAYSMFLAVVSKEPRAQLPDRRCPMCRFLDCEPTWDPV